MKIQEFSKQAVSETPPPSLFIRSWENSHHAQQKIFSFNMAENKTDHMLNIANFFSQILPQQQYLSKQQMDGYKSAFTADGYCVENKKISSRDCRGEKIPLCANFSSS